MLYARIKYNKLNNDSYDYFVNFIIENYLIKKYNLQNSSFDIMKNIVNEFIEIDFKYINHNRNVVGIVRDLNLDKKIFNIILSEDKGQILNINDNEVH